MQFDFYKTENDLILNKEQKQKYDSLPNQYKKLINAYCNCLNKALIRLENRKRLIDFLERQNVNCDDLRQENTNDNAIIEKYQYKINQIMQNA